MKRSSPYSECQICRLNYWLSKVGVKEAFKKAEKRLRRKS